MQKISQTSKFSWILDIGNTDHITFDKSLFVSFYKIKPICIKFLNNSPVTTTYVDTVKFTENLIIFNVLYIPDFAFNLIYLQHLFDNLDCQLIFSCKSCQIQDIATSKMIGHIELNKGLYYLQVLSDCNQSFVNSILN